MQSHQKFAASVAGYANVSTIDLAQDIIAVGTAVATGRIQITLIYFVIYRSYLRIVNPKQIISQLNEYQAGTAVQAT